MKILSNNLNFSYLNKLNLATSTNKYQNLAPLAKDTVSFGARLDSSDSVNLDLIDDKNVKELVRKIFEDDYILERTDIEDILDYFNYGFYRKTGDDQYKHKYLNANSIFTIKSVKSKPGRLYTDILRCSLKVINKTNGELCIVGDRLPRESEIENFNKTVANCPDEHKNPYRRNLEALNLAQNLVVQAEPEYDYETEIVVKSCKKAIEEAKTSLREGICVSGRELINLCLGEYADNANIQRILLESEKELIKIEEEIDAFKYTEGDDNTTTVEKITDFERQIREKWAIIDSKIAEQIESLDADVARRFELIKEITSDLGAINAIFKSMQNKTEVCDNQFFFSDLIRIQKELNSKIRRKAKTQVEAEPLDKCSNDKLEEKAKVIRRYLQQAQLKQETFDSIYREYLQTLEPKTIKVSTDKKEQNPPVVTPQLAVEEEPPLEEKSSPIEEPQEVLPPQSPKEIVPQGKVVDIQLIEEVPEIVTTPLSQYATEIFDALESSIAKDSVVSYAKNIIEMLKGCITEEILAGIDAMSPEDFAKMIDEKFVEISNKPEFKVNNRALNIALLDEISLCTSLDNNANIDEIYFLSDSEISKMQKAFFAGEKSLSVISQDGKPINIKISSTPDMEALDDSFKKLSSPLTSKDVEELVEELVKTYTPTISKDKLTESLSQQGKYLMLILEKDTQKTLKSKLLKFVYSDFDRLNGTNYLQDTLAIIDNERISKRMNSLLGGIDWNNF